MDVHIHIYRYYTYTHKYMHACMHTCIHTYAHTWMHTHADTVMYMQPSNSCTFQVLHRGRIRPRPVVHGTPPAFCKRGALVRGRKCRRRRGARKGIAQAPSDENAPATDSSVQTCSSTGILGVERTLGASNPATCREQKTHGSA